jgi:hypothetical protein
MEKILSLTSTLIFDFGNMDFGIAWPRMAAVIGLPILFLVELAEKTGEGKPFYQKMPDTCLDSIICRDHILFGDWDDNRIDTIHLHGLLVVK